MARVTGLEPATSGVTEKCPTLPLIRMRKRRDAKKST